MYHYVQFHENGQSPYNYDFDWRQILWVNPGKLHVVLGQSTEVQVNLCQKLFFLQNMGRTCCVQNFFKMSETITVHNMFSPGLNLEFSCIELIIQ